MYTDCCGMYRLQKAGGEDRDNEKGSCKTPSSTLQHTPPSSKTLLQVCQSYTITILYIVSLAHTQLA